MVWRALFFTIMKYLIYDENNELMRIVGRREEASFLTKTRINWSFKCVREPKQKIDFSQFKEALI